MPALLGSIVFLLISVGVTLWLLGLFPAAGSVSEATVTLTEAVPTIAAEVSTPTPVPTDAPATYGEELISIALLPAEEGAESLAVSLRDEVAARAVEVAPGIQWTDYPGARIAAWLYLVDDDLACLTLSDLAKAPPSLRLDADVMPWFRIAPGEVAPLCASPDDPEPLILALLAQAVLLDGYPGRVTEFAQAASPVIRALPTDQRVASVAAWLFFEATAVAAERPIDALRLYSAALREIPDFPAAAGNRGMVYLALNDVDAATRDTARAAELDPADRAWAYNAVLANIENENLTYLDSNWSGTPWGLNLFGVAAYQQGVFDGALSGFHRAARLDPANPNYPFNTAYVQVMTGEIGAALITYEALIDMVPTAIHYRYYGDALVLAGEMRPARNAYTTALDLAGEDDVSLRVTALTGRAVAQIGIGGWTAARADAEAALSLDPNAGRAYFVLGQISLNEGNFFHAIGWFSDAIDAGYIEAEVYAARAWAEHRERRMFAAIRDYETAVSLGDTSLETLTRAGFASFDAGDYDDAFDLFSLAANSGYDTAEVNAGLAIATDANLRRAEAEDLLIQAVELDSRYADPDALRDDPLWTWFSLARLDSILDRIADEEG